MQNNTIILGEYFPHSIISDDPGEITMIRLLKSRFDEDWQQAARSIGIEETEEMWANFEEFWPHVQPVRAVEILKFKDQDQKAVYFSFLNVAEMFGDFGRKLDEKKVVTKNKRWDEGNNEYIEDLENVFELWQVDASKLYENKEGFIYAVRCWCPTTNREFFIVVDNEAKFCKKGNYNALDAIASTASCPISNPKALYRQGDVLFWEMSDDPNNPSHLLDEPITLTGEQYIKLLVSQT